MGQLNINTTEGVRFPHSDILSWVILVPFVLECWGHWLIFGQVCTLLHIL